MQPQAGWYVSQKEIENKREREKFGTFINFQAKLRVNPHGGEYVVRRIPTGVDKVCERDGDIVCTGMFRKGGEPYSLYSSKIFTKIYTSPR